MILSFKEERKVLHILLLNKDVSQIKHGIEHPTQLHISNEVRASILNQTECLAMVNNGCLQRKGRLTYSPRRDREQINEKNTMII